MPRPSKIVQLDLEKHALKLREQGKTVRQIAEALTTRSGQSISHAAVERYLATLDRESVPPAHRPQVAEQNAALAINVGGDLQELATTLRRWFDEAQDARLFQIVPLEATDQDPNPEPLKIDIGPDWRVRLSTSREFRETLKFAADVLERIYNAEQIREFQLAVLEAVQEADPATARRIRDRMAQRSEVVKARLLGV